MLCVGVLKILLDNSNIQSAYFISMQKKRNSSSKKYLQDFSCIILPNLLQRLQLFIKMINDILTKQISPLQCTFADYLFVAIRHQIQKFLLPNLLPLYGQGDPLLGFELRNLLLISHIEQPDLFLFYNFCRYLICFFVMPLEKNTCIFAQKIFSLIPLLNYIY